MWLLLTSHLILNLLTIFYTFVLLQWTIIHLGKKFPAFMEPTDLSLWPQKSMVGPYTQEFQSTCLLHNPFLLTSILILLLHLGLNLQNVDIIWNWMDDYSCHHFSLPVIRNCKDVFILTQEFCNIFFNTVLSPNRDRGGTVVKVLCYKSEGRWFDPRWCHWNFSLT